MNTADMIQEFLEECADCEWMDTGTADDLLRAAKRDLRVHEVAAVSVQGQVKNQSDMIKELRKKQDYVKDVDDLLRRVDILQAECVAKEELLDKFARELEEAKSETVRALDVATQVNNETHEQVYKLEKKVDELWNDIMDAESRAGIYHDLILDITDSLRIPR